MYEGCAPERSLAKLCRLFWSNFCETTTPNSTPKEMRPYFIAPDGYKILSLDLSNAELRFLAYFSDCHAMLDQFNDGQDIHQLTGDLISMNLGSSEVWRYG